MQWQRPSNGMSALLVSVALGAMLVGHCDPALEMAGSRQVGLPAHGPGAPATTGDAPPILMAAVQPASWSDQFAATGPGPAQTDATAPIVVAIELSQSPLQPGDVETKPAPDAEQSEPGQAPSPPRATDDLLAMVNQDNPDPETASEPEAAISGQLLLLDMTVNGSHRGPALMMVDQRGTLYAQADTLREWGVRDPLPEAVQLSGRSFHGFGALPGVRTAVMAQDMSGTAQIPPRYLVNTTRSLAWQQGIAPTADNGAFLDYNLAYTDDPGLRTRQLSGLLNPTVFTAQGNLSAGMLYRNSDLQADSHPQGMVRLDTTWTRDIPDLMASLRVGDAVTPQNSWARSLRFGGIQWATNFATQPTLVTFPQPSITGSAAVPTAMDIFVNGSLRSTQDLPDGTFRIEDIPVVTGAGQIQVVTRDVMGREQLLVQDFYASPQLLRPGLSDYAVSLGALRQNYALESNDYSDVMLSAMLRRGISSDLTLEGRIDGTADLQVASGGAFFSMPRIGMLSTALALSRQEQTGVLWQVGHQYQGRRFRFDLRLQGASEHFAQPGIDLPNAFPRLQSLVSGGTNFDRLGTLGVSLIDQKFHDSQYDRRLLTISFARPLPDNFSLNLSGSYIQAEENDLQASLLVMKYFGGRRSASATLQHSRAFQNARLEYRSDVPTGPGFGYRTAAYAGDSSALEAETTWHTDYNRLQAEVRNLDGDSGWRASVAGSLTWLGGDWYANREIHDGFAVVDASGFEGVRVYLENRPMGVTDQHGRLLVPGLLPYQANRLSIDSRDLPLTARVGSTSEAVAPYYRSGTVVAFDVDTVSSALLRVTWPDGTPVPEGSEALIVGRTDIYPVGRNGRLYLPDLAGATRILVRNHVWQCHLELPDISRIAHEGIPNLGEFTCLNELN